MASEGATIRPLAKFGVGDSVRFIGTDTLFTIMQYNAETLEYQVQHGPDLARSQWVLEEYLEPI